MNGLIFPFAVGEFHCLVINDALRAWTAGDLIGNATTTEQLARIELEFDLDLDKIPVPDDALLLNIGVQNVLIDAGSCKRPFPGDNEGDLLRNLQAAGVNPGDVDSIIITHSDYDHIGGILNKEGSLEFPNAQYYLSANSWAYWSSPDGRAKMTALTGWSDERIEFVWGTYSTIRERLTIVEYEEEFIPGFRMYAAEGHHYDHDVLKIESAGEKLIHIADGLLSPLFMAYPDWYFYWDADPEKAVGSKERLLEWCAAEEALVFAAHFPFPGLGTIDKSNGSWRWHPYKV